MIYYTEVLHTELECYIKASTERLERSRASKYQIQKGDIILSINLVNM
jgi:hypothetical protein